MVQGNIGFFTNFISLEEVKEQVREEGEGMIYYGANTCWWTHRNDQLYLHPESGLPCDPRGGMLLQTDDVEGFLSGAEENPDYYGRHGLQAFIAAHNWNCVVSASDRRPTCFEDWEQYNIILDNYNREDS